MARLSGAMVTFNDLTDMVLDGELQFKTSIPSSDECVTRDDLETYADVDPLLLTGYAGNRLVPYSAIRNVLYGDPFAFNVGYLTSSTNFTLHNPVGEAWSITDDAAWLSVTPDAGVTSTETITVSYNTNINTSSRQATITLTSVTGGTSTVVVTQIANPGVATDPVNLSVNDSANRCDFDVGEAATYFIPEGEDWASATDFFMNSTGTVNPPAGYYTDGSFWKEWTGSSFFDTGVC